MDEYTNPYTNPYNHSPPHHPHGEHYHTQESANYQAPPPETPPLPPPPPPSSSGGFLTNIVPANLETHLPLILMGLGALGVYLYIKQDDKDGLLGHFLK